MDSESWLELEAGALCVGAKAVAEARRVERTAEIFMFMNDNLFCFVEKFGTEKMKF